MQRGRKYAVSGSWHGPALYLVCSRRRLRQGLLSGFVDLGGWEWVFSGIQLTGVSMGPVWWEDLRHFIYALAFSFMR